MLRRFNSGDKIVCINDKKPNQETLKNFDSWITNGNTYTVREQRCEGLEFGVLLKEITNNKYFASHLQGYIEPAYHPNRFIKLEEFCGKEESNNKELLLAVN